ncbi:hypothetical protein N7G274_001798 [Stereocaulon virgatum]|uniref:Ribosomal protein L9 domain-containing protein n=1 Tax=Stereocaulon virgatum TaxID=373712 RepID=A0ABR4ANH9_9LECA
MAGLCNSARTPLCLACTRRLVRDDLSQLWSPFFTQIRGKKKTAKRPTTIKVKLLEDIKGYGKQGSITLVEPGRMRNSWFPRHKAEYVTVSTLQGLKPREVVAERDVTFGMTKEETAEALPAEKEQVLEAPTVQTKTKLLPSERATEIMESLLPSHVVFYRTPISISEEDTPEPPPIRPRRAATSAAAELDAASEPLPKPPKPQLAKLFGSVSTADVADSFKAILDQTEEGSRVVLGAEDIKFLGTEQLEGAESQETGIEGGRIKALGDFKVEARVKGGDTVIRTVSVRAQEEDEQ